VSEGGWGGNKGGIRRWFVGRGDEKEEKFSLEKKALWWGESLPPNRD